MEITKAEYLKKYRGINHYQGIDKQVLKDLHVWEKILQEKPQPVGINSFHEQSSQPEYKPQTGRRSK